MLKSRLWGGLMYDREFQIAPIFMGDAFLNLSWSMKMNK